MGLDYLNKHKALISIALILLSFINTSIPFVAIGLLFIYMSVNGLRFLKQLERNGLKCDAQILSYEVDWKGYQMPIVEFTAANGLLVKRKPFIYLATSLSTLRSYRKVVGRTVPILYLPEEPEKFILLEERRLNYMSLSITIILGLAFIVAVFFFDTL